MNAELASGKVTICLVNYKTEELIRLCLRSIRKYTHYPCELIVIDNGSADGSLEYLRSLDWITLIERAPGEMTRTGSWAQGTALDMGLRACKTEFFLAMHSDAIVHKDGWLSEFVGECGPGTACAGSGKLDLKPRWQMLLKEYTDYQEWIRRRQGVSKPFYIRAICALYRTEILRRENLTFFDPEKNFTCGQEIYLKLVEKGCPVNVISPWKMAKFIYHLAHATMVFNPEFTVRRRTEKKCKRRLENILKSPIVEAIQNDCSLDR
ncbi:MAG: glycosyltransferase family 2 protein [Victivallales bacterium]|nr:glycosyltransferase family 2 protein [Victivallales bacterium]